MSGSQTSEALWYAAPGCVEIRSEPLPPPASGEVRVRMLHSAVSRGTESLVLAGRVPASEFQRMRGPGMGGVFPFPVKYGYAAVGVVEDGPSALAGQTVFALYPHQTLFNISAAAVTPLPEGVPAQRAVLAANMETALNALWDASPGPADRIAIIGSGVVGALVAYLCARLPGTEVALVDVDVSRRGLAEAFGAVFYDPQSAPEDCDVVFHASGSAAGLATAIRLAGQESTICEMSWYGAGDVSVPLGGAFHSRRLRIIGSQVGAVAASHRPRWDFRRRLNAALRLLKDPALDALFAEPMAFADAPRMLPAVLAPGSGVLCQRIDYPA